MGKIQFAPSLMCMDFLDMRNQLEILNQRADMLHVDIMDGHYCKNITLSPDMIRTFARVAKLPMDVHFMTTNPSDWYEVCAQAGAKILSPHAETINVDAFRTLNLIERLGCKAGIILNPASPISITHHYIERIDILTIMTVDVGFAGQAFIPEMLAKIEEAAELKAKHGYKYLIQIDGSCNERTYKRLVDAGAEVLIVGSSGLFSLDSDLNVAYDKMLASFEKAIAQ
ncbi:MAG: D-allulose 6-phosphate 3-epimerase [Candidatus Limiplasma sp.]|nr:D-allulose 6-phosphate 3-epimerase [Candidatus Limiplasma sp.]MEA5146781.1 D-allulose 6-phosphate 3-epimerase [Candidatus Limiplasma sp.]